MPMLYQEHLPHVALAQHIKCYWVLEAPISAFSREQMPPDTYVELVFNFADPLLLKSGKNSYCHTAQVFLTGLRNQPLQFYGTAVCQIIAVRLYPWMVYPLVGLQPEPTLNSVIPLSGRWLTLCQRVTKVVASMGLGAALPEVEQFVGEAISPLNGEHTVIGYASELLYLSQGQMRVHALAGECGLSINQLERLFKCHVGVSPKALARLIRVEAIRDRLVHNSSSRLIELAHEFGYTDQAHFVRDFKALAGLTPGQFVSYLDQKTDS